MWRCHHCRMLHIKDLARPKKRNKFSAVKTTTADGITHDSKREASRWVHLQTMQRAGLISSLERQVRFQLVVNGHKVCAYVADFVYVEAGARVVEDVKSEITRKRPEYRIKVKLMRAVHGINVREVL